MTFFPSFLVPDHSSFTPTRVPPWPSDWVIELSSSLPFLIPSFSHLLNALSNPFSEDCTTSLFSSEAYNQFLASARHATSRSSHGFLLHGLAACCPTWFAFRRNTSHLPSLCPHSHKAVIVPHSCSLVRCSRWASLLYGTVLPECTSLPEFSHLVICDTYGIYHIFQPVIVYLVSCIPAFQALFPAWHEPGNQADGRCLMCLWDVCTNSWDGRGRQGSWILGLGEVYREHKADGNFICSLWCFIRASSDISSPL